MSTTSISSGNRRDLKLTSVCLLGLLFVINCATALKYASLRIDAIPQNTSQESAVSSPDQSQRSEQRKWPIEPTSFQNATEKLLFFGAELRSQILRVFGKLIYERYDDFDIGQIEALHRIHLETLERKYNIFDIVPSVFDDLVTNPTKICGHINKNVHTCLRETSKVCMNMTVQDEPSFEYSDLQPYQQAYRSLEVTKSYPSGFSLKAVLHHLRAGRLRLTPGIISGLLQNIQYDHYNDKIREAEDAIVGKLHSNDAPWIPEELEKSLIRESRSVDQLLKNFLKEGGKFADVTEIVPAAYLSKHVVRGVDSVSAEIEYLGIVHDNGGTNLKYLFELILPNDTVDPDILEARDALRSSLEKFRLIETQMGLEKYEDTSPDQLLMRILRTLRAFGLAEDVAKSLYVHANFWHRSHMIDNLRDLLELFDAYENLRRVKSYERFMKIVDTVKGNLRESDNVTIELLCSRPRECLRIGLRIIANCASTNAETKGAIESFLERTTCGCSCLKEDSWNRTRIQPQNTKYYEKFQGGDILTSMDKYPGYNESDESTEKEIIAFDSRTKSAGSAESNLAALGLGGSIDHSESHDSTMTGEREAITDANSGEIIFPDGATAAGSISVDKSRATESPIVLISPEMSEEKAEPTEISCERGNCTGGSCEDDDCRSRRGLNICIGPDCSETSDETTGDLKKSSESLEKSGESREKLRTNLKDIHCTGSDCSKPSCESGDCDAGTRKSESCEGPDCPTCEGTECPENSTQGEIDCEGPGCEVNLQTIPSYVPETDPCQGPNCGGDCAGESCEKKLTEICLFPQCSRSNEVSCKDSDCSADESNLSNGCEGSECSSEKGSLKICKGAGCPVAIMKKQCEGPECSSETTCGGPDCSGPATGITCEGPECSSETICEGPSCPGATAEITCEGPECSSENKCEGPECSSENKCEGPECSSETTCGGPDCSGAAAGINCEGPACSSETTCEGTDCSGAAAGINCEGPACSSEITCEGPECSSETTCEGPDCSEAATGNTCEGPECSSESKESSEHCSGEGCPDSTAESACGGPDCLPEALDPTAAACDDENCSNEMCIGNDCKENPLLPSEEVENSEESTTPRVETSVETETGDSGIAIASCNNSDPHYQRKLHRLQKIRIRDALASKSKSSYEVFNALINTSQNADKKIADQIGLGLEIDRKKSLKEAAPEDTSSRKKIDEKSHATKKIDFLVGAKIVKKIGSDGLLGAISESNISSSSTAPLSVQIDRERVKHHGTSSNEIRESSEKSSEEQKSLKMRNEISDDSEIGRRWRKTISAIGHGRLVKGSEKSGLKDVAGSFAFMKIFSDDNENDKPGRSESNLKGVVSHRRSMKTVSKKESKSSKKWHVSSKNHELRTLSKNEGKTVETRFLHPWNVKTGIHYGRPVNELPVVEETIRTVKRIPKLYETTERTHRKKGKHTKEVGRKRSPKAKLTLPWFKITAE